TLLGLTGGLPAIVLPTVQYLQARSWVVGSDELTALFTGTASSSAKDHGRRSVLALVQDSGARELLYRVSILCGTFDHDLLWAVARVPPAVDHAGSRLDELLGPWITARKPTGFSVNPLVLNAGATVLDPALFREIHRAAGIAYLRKRTFDVTTATATLLHLL